MAPQASPIGNARIKGSTKLQRMAMLTFALIGLQHVLRLRRNFRQNY